MDSSDLLVGVISAAVWTFIVLGYWAGRRHYRYRGLKGTFEVRQRFDPNRGVHWIASVTPAGNRLEVSGERPPGDRRTQSFQGEILMSDQLSNSGLGHYVRDDEPHAFGFWRVQLVDNNKLLVLETWANQERRGVTDGLIWTRLRE